MLISERKLRRLVRETINESFGTEYGSSSGSSNPQVTPPAAGVVVQGGGGYTYEIFPDGKIQMLSKGSTRFTPPTSDK